MKRQSLLLVLSVLILVLVATSCRKDEPTATPVTDAETPAVTAEATEVADDEATLEPGPTAVQVTEFDYDWPPQVVYSSPAPGEELLLDGAITIRFDQPMDEGSVEEALLVSPAGSNGPVDGRLEWPRPDTLIFTPAEQLAREQQYDVEVKDTARGKNGKPLREPVMLQVSTVGFLEVSQVIPDDGTNEVQTDGAVTVMFNRPVVPLASSTQQVGLPQPLEFSPAVTGEGRWVSTSIYRFTPDPPLDGATTYQLTVPAGLEDVTGGVLGETYSWRFTTLSPSVVSISPEDQARDVELTRPMTVTFNMPMDPGATGSAISLSPRVQVDTVWSEDNRQVTLITQAMLDLATDYQLQVAESARSLGGQATLDRETQSTFSTVQAPAVLEVEPGPNRTAERFNRGVRIRFASPMDLATLEDKILIDPAPDRTNYYYNDWDFSLFIDFDTERITEYEVTVPASAADPYGNMLGQDYTWRFTTPGHPPLVSLNLPMAISQLSTNLPSNVEVIHRNVSRIDAALYDAGLPADQLVASRLHEYTPPGQPQRTWSISVDTPPETAGFYELALADGGVLPTGVYYLQINSPESIEEHVYWQNQENLLVVADTNLVVKETFESVHAWATDLATGQPAAGRNLTLYNDLGVAISNAVTDQDGLATLPYSPREDHLAGALVVSNSPGEAGFGVASSNWNEGTNPWSFGVEMAWNDEPLYFGYIYTDRPIYRPGDTVHFRGIVRDTNYGRYPFPTATSVALKINYLREFETVDYEFAADLDDNGEFSGQYVIPEDAGLGDYRLFFADQQMEGDRIFSVAEYRAPEFQVTMEVSEKQALRGEAVDVVVQATYFFGGAASGLPVEWFVETESYRLPWEGPYFSFGDSASFFNTASDGPIVPVRGFGRQQVLSGEGTTDADGRLTITLPATLLDEVDPGSQQVTVSANVLDISGFPVAAQTQFVLHEGQFYAGVVPDRYIARAGVTSDINVVTVDWDSQPVPDRAVDLTFYERVWTPVRDQRFNQYYTRWEVEDTEIEQQTVTTDAQGKVTAGFVPPSGGTYVIVATVRDDGGREQSSSVTMWVTDIDAVGWAVDPRDKKMDLVADKDSYRPGDIAQVLVQSPFNGPVNAWLTVERGDVIEQRLITLLSNSEVIEVPISAAYAPNVFVSIHAVKGVDESSPVAEIRIGLAELVVTPEQLALNVAITPRNDTYSPGDTAEYELLATDYQGNPVRANLSIALVDLAVLTLKSDNAPHIVEAFYRRQPLRSLTGAGLIISGEGLEAEVPAEVLGLGGGGGGADVSAAPAIALERDTESSGAEIRTDFRDTAFWEAKVSTDASGRATVSIPLPDNITTWRLSSKAVSDYGSTIDTLVGQGDADIVSTLPLLIRPVTPRFFTVGDALNLGAVIHNNTDESLDVTVTLEASGLTLSGPSTHDVSIAPGTSQLVRWPVTVDDERFADLTFRAEGGQYADATKPTFGQEPDQLIPIVRYTGEDVVGTSGVLDEADRRVEAILLPEEIDTRQGAVNVQLSPSLAAALIPALEVVNNLEDRPACAHGTADQLLPNVATMNAYQRLSLSEFDQVDKLESLILQGINDLERLQKGDGGWGWCHSDDSDPFLSGYVLLSLASAQNGGYVVDQSVIDRASRYVQSQIEEAENLAFATEVNRQAFFLYVLAELGRADLADLEGLFDEHRALLDPYAKALLAMAFDLAGDSGHVSSLLADLNDSAIMSAAGAHWQDAVPDWDNLSSDIRGTAMVLEALTRLDSDSPLVPNAVRWLMVARQAERWPSGHDTAWSIMALSDWMAVSGELEADFNYQLDANMESLARGHFGPENVLQSEDRAVPVSALIPDDVNFLTFQRDTGPGRLYYTAYLNSFISAENLAPLDRGFTVERAYFDASCDPAESQCEPITEMEAGQEVRVELNVVVPKDGVYVVINEPIPAGAEAVDPGLETTLSAQGGRIQRIDEGYVPGYWGWWYFNNIEYRDDQVVFRSEFLPAGTYQYSYTLQTIIPGTYQVNPATARLEFFPDVFGRSDGFLFEIVE